VENILSALLTQAAESPAGPAAQGPAGCPQGGMGMLFPIVLMFAIIYFLMIRPQQKQQKQHQTMLKALKKGDRVLTASGIFGTIVNLTDTVVTLEIAKSVHIRLLRGQVAALQPDTFDKGGEDAAIPGGNIKP
jgi:preprotein translocase subunit YajC